MWKLKFPKVTFQEDLWGLLVIMIGMVSVFKNIPLRVCEDECKTDFSLLEEDAECEEENKF